MINGARIFPQVVTRRVKARPPSFSHISFSSKFRMKLSNIAFLTSLLSSLPPLIPPEWFDSGSNSKLLQDLDNSSVMEDGRKKLNTVFHYQVCVCVSALVDVVSVYLYSLYIFTATVGVLEVRTPCEWCH